MEYVKVRKSWENLLEGDIVDIVAPAYGVNESELEISANYLHSLGLKPRFSDNLIGDDLFFSNTDTVRHEHLKQALYANDSKAVWCVKGGYGTSHLLPALYHLPTPIKAKLVIGFSDITALHLFLIQEWKWHTVHAPVLWQTAMGKIDKKSIDLLTDIIFGKSNNQNFALEPVMKGNDGIIESTVVGGNLTIVQNSIGTNWQIESDDKIVLLEEVDEEPYRIDRIFTHLRQSGVLYGAKAIILGEFLHENMDEKKLEYAINLFAESIDIPVLRTQHIGHGERNYPMPLNTRAKLTIGNTCNIICDSGFYKN